jgi:hypothetical protein
MRGEMLANGRDLTGVGEPGFSLALANESEHALARAHPSVGIWNPVGRASASGQRVVTTFARV